MKKAIIVALVVFSAQTIADDSQRPSRPEGRPSIPQASFDACSDKSESQSCSFEDDRGNTMSGTCSLPPPDSDSDALSCRPNRNNDNFGPPPQDN